MPCRSDYMEPFPGEIELSNVYQLLDELRTGELTKEYGKGFDRRAYCHFNQEDLDNKTAELCHKLQVVDISKCSLEMQMWWRNHKEADKKRIEKELEELKDDAARQVAISKLTPHERKLLGL